MFESEPTLVDAEIERKQRVWCLRAERVLTKLRIDEFSDDSTSLKEAENRAKFLELFARQLEAKRVKYRAAIAAASSLEPDEAQKSAAKTPGNIAMIRLRTSVRNLQRKYQKWTHKKRESSSKDKENAESSQNHVESTTKRISPSRSPTRNKPNHRKSAPLPSTDHTYTPTSSFSRSRVKTSYDAHVNRVKAAQTPKPKPTFGLHSPSALSKSLKQRSRSLSPSKSRSKSSSCIHVKVHSPELRKFGGSSENHGNKKRAQSLPRGSKKPHTVKHVGWIPPDYHSPPDVSPLTRRSLDFDDKRTERNTANRATRKSRALSSPVLEQSGSHVKPPVSSPRQSKFGENFQLSPGGGIHNGAPKPARLSYPHSNSISRHKKLQRSRTQDLDVHGVHVRSPSRDKYSRNRQRSRSRSRDYQRGIRHSSSEVAPILQPDSPFFERLKQINDEADLLCRSRSEEEIERLSRPRSVSAPKIRITRRGKSRSRSRPRKSSTRRSRPQAQKSPRTRHASLMSSRSKNNNNVLQSFISVNRAELFGDTLRLKPGTLLFYGRLVFEFHAPFHSPSFHMMSEPEVAAWHILNMWKQSLARGFKEVPRFGYIHAYRLNCEMDFSVRQAWEVSSDECVGARKSNTVVQDSVQRNTYWSRNIRSIDMLKRHFSGKKLAASLLKDYQANPQASHATCHLNSHRTARMQRLHVATPRSCCKLYFGGSEKQLSKNLELTRVYEVDIVEWLQRMLEEPCSLNRTKILPLLDHPFKIRSNQPSSSRKRHSKNRHKSGSVSLSPSKTRPASCWSDSESLSVDSPTGQLSYMFRE